jgi:hypothetical protein
MFSLTTRTASAAAAVTGAAALFARARFGHGNIPSTHIATAEAGNGCLSGFRRIHGHECKSAGATRHAIRDDVDFGYVTELLERVLQIVFGGLKGKISHKQFSIHNDFNPDSTCSFLAVPDCRVSNHH